MRQRDRHRLPYGAAARGIVVCVTCALCIGAISLPRPPNRAAVPPNTDQQQLNAIQQNPAPTLAPGVAAAMDRIARALEAANAGRNSPGENRRANDSLDAQKQIAFWGMVIAVIGAFGTLATAAGVILVAFALHATRRVAKAAEDTARAALESANAISHPKPTKEESPRVVRS